MGVTVGSWWWVGLVVSNGFGFGFYFLGSFGKSTVFEELKLGINFDKLVLVPMWVGVGFVWLDFFWFGFFKVWLFQVW